MVVRFQAEGAPEGAHGHTQRFVPSPVSRVWEEVSFQNQPQGAPNATRGGTGVCL